jgi:hypothetical protein
MQIISTTTARKNLGKYISTFLEKKDLSFVFGRRDQPEAILIPFPNKFKPNKNLSDIANLAMYGGSFDFLFDEPDLYSIKDTLEFKNKKHASKK